jgi:DNA-directed RNA polymerase specialized sigma24 family protein
MAILRRWPTYRADRATVEAWVCGVVHTELRGFRREQGARSPHGADACILVEAPDLEHRAATAEIAVLLLDTLPAGLVRVVVLHDVAGCTYREIARSERISKSEAHARHAEAMAALATAAARLNQRAPRRRTRSRQGHVVTADSDQRRTELAGNEARRGAP